MRYLTILVAVFALALAGCDAAEFFGPSGDGGPSQAYQTLEDVSPLIPNGLPRVLADLALAALAIWAGKSAKSKAVAISTEKLETRHDGGYTYEEAEAMLAAMKKLKKAGSDVELPV